MISSSSKLIKHSPVSLSMIINQLPMHGKAHNYLPPISV